MHSKITLLQTGNCWLSWKLSGIGKQTYMVRNLLFILTIDPWHTSLRNKISPLTNSAGLKILLIFLYSVLSKAPRDLLTSFQMWYLDALIFLPLTLLCPIPLTRFSSSRSKVLSWGGTGIMCMISMPTKMCWWMTLETSWFTKEIVYTILQEYNNGHGHFS